MSAYRADVQSAFPLSPTLAGRLEQAAVAALERHGAQSGCEVSIMLTDRDEIRRLNREYRGLDQATDVLSFELNEALPEGGIYLGDVVISLPVAQEQADSGGHELLAELSLLVIHGVLHLLGHDHTGVDDQAEMWSRQAELLEELGLHATPTED